MQASSHAIDLINRFEGLRTTAYKAVPSEKYFTIGYGHYGPDVGADMVITAARAEALLKSDLKQFERDLTKALGAGEIEVTQSQFDALLSLTYNIGITALINSTLWELLSAGDIRGAADQFLRWDYSGGKKLPGLTKRRKAERALFLS